MLNDFQKEVLADNGMKKAFIAIIVVLPIVLVVLPALFITIAVLTEGNITIENGGKIIFGYDSKTKSFIINEYRKYALNGIDGPYIIGNEIITVDSENRLIRKEIKTDSVIVRVDNEDNDKFSVELSNELIKQRSVYEMPEKLIAISDIEGNFNAFSSFLISNNVIDESYNWIFGNGHLVLNGDMVDRGDNVIPVLWLIYKLEFQAEKSGGKVHFILGNHDVMNIQGKFRYARDKYKKLAELLGNDEDNSDNNKILFAENTVLGKWMRSKNVIEKIGNNIFVHAGLSKDLIDLNMNPVEINSFVRGNYDTDYSENEDKTAKILYSRMGPLWYRGMAMDYKYYSKITDKGLTEVLNYFNAERIIIGHTVVEDVSSDYSGRVIKIDLKHGKEKYTGKTKGILIEDNDIFVLDDLGNSTALKIKER